MTSGARTPRPAARASKPKEAPKNRTVTAIAQTVRIPSPSLTRFDDMVHSADPAEGHRVTAASCPPRPRRERDPEALEGLDGLVRRAPSAVTQASASESSACTSASTDPDRGMLALECLDAPQPPQDRAGLVHDRRR